MSGGTSTAICFYQAMILSGVVLEMNGNKDNKLVFCQSHKMDTKFHTKVDNVEWMNLYNELRSALEGHSMLSSQETDRNAGTRMTHLKRGESQRQRMAMPFTRGGSSSSNSVPQKEGQDEQRGCVSDKSYYGAHRKGKFISASEWSRGAQHREDAMSSKEK